jgi:urease accessory protein
VSIVTAGSSTLYWSDALMAGRQARGERWGFAQVCHELRLVCAGTLDYLERYRIAPAESPPARPWIADDAGYVGSALLAGTCPGDVAELHRGLASIDGLRAAADRLSSRLVVVRLLGLSGAAFHEARNVLSRRTRAASPVAAPDSR